MNINNKSNMKFIIIILYFVILFILIFGVTDYLRIKNYKEAIFCVEVNQIDNLDNLKKCQGVGYYILFRNSNKEINELSYYKFYVLGYEFSNGYNGFSQKTYLRNLINLKTILIFLFLTISGVYYKNKKNQD